MEDVYVGPGVLTVSASTDRRPWPPAFKSGTLLLIINGDWLVILVVRVDHVCVVEARKV